MPLSSFLLKPMQRITRYPLLIRSVSPGLGCLGSRAGLAGQEPDTQEAVIPLPLAPGTYVCSLKASVLKRADVSRI